jgi:hypothetical protein
MLSVLKEMVKFLYHLHRFGRYWMVPLIIGLVLLGSLLVAVQGSAIAPFIYTIY